jgi:pyruvate formate lyase activating enzyme
MKNGIIFDIKRYAIHDGPGIRTTVFFKGCPLRCAWCHNPEGQSLKPELSFNETRCLKSCEECVVTCSKKALSRVEQHISINRNECDLCGDCAEVCPTEALEIIGREVSVGEVIEEIEKDMIFYEESGGGVTFSGGEPLMQPEFLNALLEECKKRNIHTCLDTGGYTSPEGLDKIRDKVKLFLYDLKMMDEKKHEEATKASNKSIIKNLKKLSEDGSKIIVRIPIVPGVNDSDENIAQTAEFIASLGGVDDIGLLPYHRGGCQKYMRLSKVSSMNDIHPPSDKEIKKIKKRLEQFGFNVRIGE